MSQEFYRAQEVRKVVSIALECSVYHNPTDPGLSLDELLELGDRFGIGRGEMKDFAPGGARDGSARAARYLPSAMVMASNFNFRKEPEYRNRAAFQHVFDQLREVVRTEGRGAALPAEIVIERGAQKLTRNDIQVAITFLILEGVLVRVGEGLRFSQPHNTAPNEQSTGKELASDPQRAAIYAAVGDIIGRRTDGRPSSSDALMAFAERLEAMGHGHFRMWWTQTLLEIRQLDPNRTPTAVLVLAASLVEGALTFVVGHARTVNVGPMGSKTFEGSPRTWKLEELIQSAAQGGKEAILDNSAKTHAVDLISARQRIHAGRMLEEHPKSIPDLKPEEARKALATAETVARRILDWVEAHPST